MEAILEAIRANGEARVREIERRAQAQVGAILSAAEAEAQRLRQEAKSAILSHAAGERFRIINQARLAALRRAGEAREAFITAVLERTKQELANLRSDKAYPSVLRRLTEEAVSLLAGPQETAVEAELEADARDRELLARTLKELGVPLAVRYSIACWGGLIARSADGRVIVINTLEARLERALPFLRRSLAVIFESGQVVLPASQVLEPMRPPGSRGRGP
ncbi:MAG: V-type ATP synthase subunit E [Chloroflexota bacterium]